MKLLGIPVVIDPDMEPGPPLKFGPAELIGYDLSKLEYQYADSPEGPWFSDREGPYVRGFIPVDLKPAYTAVAILTHKPADPPPSSPRGTDCKGSGDSAAPGEDPA